MLPYFVLHSSVPISQSNRETTLAHKNTHFNTEAGEGVAHAATTTTETKKSSRYSGKKKNWLFFGLAGHIPQFKKTKYATTVPSPPPDWLAGKAVTLSRCGTLRRRETLSDTHRLTSEEHSNAARRIPPDRWDVYDQAGVVLSHAGATTQHPEITNGQERGLFFW